MAEKMMESSRHENGTDAQEHLGGSMEEGMEGMGSMGEVPGMNNEEGSGGSEATQGRCSSDQDDEDSGTYRLKNSESKLSTIQGFLWFIYRSRIRT
jgi:hypothetical protein